MQPIVLFCQPIRMRFLLRSWKRLPVESQRLLRISGVALRLLSRKKAGFLFRFADIERLKEAVEWMINHPVDRLRMGKNARETAVGRYDHRILTARLIEVHRGLIR